jgi:hypothetical protein
MAEMHWKSPGSFLFWKKQEKGVDLIFFDISLR